jgi:hypothetical protein
MNRQIRRFLNLSQQESSSFGSLVRLLEAEPSLSGSLQFQVQKAKYNWLEQNYEGKLLMANITVTRKSDSKYLVAVEEGSSRSTHSVMATPDHIARYASADTLPEKLVEASFEFLLERESKESILTSFDLSVIEQYFPEYPRRIRDYLKEMR